MPYIMLVDLYIKCLSTCYIKKGSIRDEIKRLIRHTVLYTMVSFSDSNI